MSRFELEGETVAVAARADATRTDGFVVTLGEREIAVTAVTTPDGRLLVTLPDGRRLRAAVTRDGERRWVSVQGRHLVVREVEAAGAGAGPEGGLEAPMPGKVLEILVAVGDEVEAGQTLMIIEAMKMEHAIKAPHAGTVTALSAAEGDMVGPGTALASVEP